MKIQTTQDVWDSLKIIFFFSIHPLNYKSKTYLRKQSQNLENQKQLFPDFFLKIS